LCPETERHGFYFFLSPLQHNQFIHNTHGQLMPMLLENVLLMLIVQRVI
jgi:hypothetical protein